MISLFFFLLSSLGCVITANLIRTDNGKVIDIIHNNIPLLRAPYLSDVLVLIQTVGTATIMDVKTLSEMLLIMSIIQLLRILCSASTALPPLKNYHDKYRLGGLNGTGTEYIFSGHASYSALCAIYLYTEKITPTFHLVIYNFITQFLIIATHNHYTVDVLLAWIIVPLLYGNIMYCRNVDWCNNIINHLL